MALTFQYCVTCRLPAREFLYLFRTYSPLDNLVHKIIQSNQAKGKAKAKPTNKALQSTRINATVPNDSGRSTQTKK